MVARPVGHDERRHVLQAPARRSAHCPAMVAVVRRCSISSAVRSPTSTRASPPATSSTKWLAVATTANAIASGESTARTRTRERGGRGEQDDAHEDVPAHVQARERGELVRQPRRLERAVGLRALGHRVDEPEVEQPRRGDRHQREEEEADRSGDEHRVAQHAVVRPVREVQRDGRGEDHRPVAPDVDPVRERDQRRRCRRRAPWIAPSQAMPSVLLEVEEAGRVVPRRRLGADGRVPHAEVDEHRERDEHDLPREPVVDARPSTVRRSTARRPTPADALALEFEPWDVDVAISLLATQCPADRHRRASAEARRGRWSLPDGPETMGEGARRTHLWVDPTRPGATASTAVALRRPAANERSPLLVWTSGQARYVLPERARSLVLRGPRAGPSSGSSRGAKPLVRFRVLRAAKPAANRRERALFRGLPASAEADPRIERRIRSAADSRCSPQQTRERVEGIEPS